MEEPRNDILEMIPDGCQKPIPTWIGIFHLLEGKDPRQVIGRYFIADFSRVASDMRHFGFFLKGSALVMNEALCITQMIDHWESNYFYTSYRGILRDLWELPLTENTDLQAGKFLWFLHCFEYVCPNMFPGYAEYCQKRDGIEQWTRDRLEECRLLA